MEVIRTIGSVMGSIKMLVDLIAKNRELAGAVAAGLRSMIKDFELIRTVRLQRKQQQLQLTPGMELLLQELAYDIEDFIQGLWDPGPCGSFVLSAIGADSRPLLIQRISDFKESIKNLKDELPKSFEAMPAGPSSSAGSPIPYSPEVDLVGMEGPKGKIVELLVPRVEPHRGRLCVVSIVGCSGSGKTALARALYEDDAVTKDFDYKAWVVASDLTSAAILDKIRQEAVPTSPPGSPLEALHHFEKQKRYLVFVDDVLRGKTCADIKKAFHDNEMDSRIIVTTSVHSVAMECSSGSFVYTMQGLDKENSIELLCRKCWVKDGYSEKDKYRLGNKGVDFIVDKCDGLPIALISAAECLRGKSIEQLKDSNFITVSQELGDTLECSESEFERYKKRNGNETTFVAMRRAFVKPYESLLNNGEKDCLLYVSIFPSGYQINNKSLVRILIAEGLGPGDPCEMKDSELVVSDVCECLRMLMDHRMIDPVPVRSNCNAAKKCKVHSIMLQFTIKKAVSRNFVSLIHEGKSHYSTAGSVRRLAIQSSSDARSTGDPEKMNLSVLRSLTIFERGIVDFKKCKLVRVLNLEGCCGLTRKDLKKICGLLFLKYLSLRKTDIKELPKKVKNLQCLETLDTRETEVIKLPVEVIMLPQFAYLFGKFELTNVHDENIEKLDKYFSKNKSQLHTLGGIAVHETKGLEIVLLIVKHARKLKKVKVWYKDTAASIVLPAKRRAVDNGRKVMHKLARLGIGSRQKGLGPATLHAPLSTATATSGQKSNMVWSPSESKPSAGPSTDSSGNTLDPAPGTSTPLASDTPELIHLASRLAETLQKHPITLESLSIDFNGVSNTFLDFLQINGTISSIKLRRGQKILPGPDRLGKVCNLKKLHLFSTGLESKELAALQHLKCLQYLKLEEEGHGLWDSVFHVQDRGFISLIWLCFESSNSKPPPLKIDEGVKTPLASLLLLCKDSHPRVEGISHLAKLNEVILHKNVSGAIVKTWKEEAKKHVNRPYVEKQQV